MASMPSYATVRYPIMLDARQRRWLACSAGMPTSVRYRTGGLISREQKTLAVEIIEAEIRSAQHEVLLEAAWLVLIDAEPIEIARQLRDRAERTIRPGQDQPRKSGCRSSPLGITPQHTSWARLRILSSKGSSRLTAESSQLKAAKALSVRMEYSSRSTPLPF